MGHLEDNMYISLHAPRPLASTQIEIRHHLGVRGIDQMAVLPWAQWRVLKDAALESWQDFDDALKQVAPDFHAHLKRQANGDDLIRTLRGLLFSSINL